MSDQHPLQTGRAAHLRWLLDNASTQEEWNRAVAALVHYLAQAGWPRVVPSLGAADRWRETEWDLHSRIAAGFQKRRGAPRRAWEAFEDSFFLQMRTTFADAAAILAKRERTTIGEARKRLLRMEKQAGAQLPRARRFGRK